jgi:tetratricopeptide (TPR) repeat protein
MRKALPYFAAVVCLLTPLPAQISAEDWRQRGLALFRERKFAEALKAFERAIQLDPAYSNAWMNRATLHYENGDFSAALADYNKSVEADPANAFANQARAELARLPAPAQPKPQPPPPPPPALTQPPPGPPAYLRENLDINHLTPAAYDAQVRASREAVRILLGPMSADDEKRFEQKWAPLFEYPCQPVIDYFHKLTPLLNRFLDTRAALQQALISFNDAYEEAVTAAAPARSRKKPPASSRAAPPPPAAGS